MKRVKIDRIKCFRYEGDIRVIDGFYYLTLSGKLLSGSRFRNIDFVLSPQDYSILRDKRLESIGI